LRENITRDPRHGQVCVLLEELLEHRNFPDWAMDFHNLDQVNVAHLTGFSNLLSSSLSAADLKNDPSLAKKLLLVFKEGNQKPQGSMRHGDYPAERQAGPRWRSSRESSLSGREIAGGSPEVGVFSLAPNK
jgi:hypothetical protein